MDASTPPTVASALDELLDVSPQVLAAIVLDRDSGQHAASAPDTAHVVADRFATICMQILRAAERSRTELGREPVSQVEISAPDGHVFVVGDARWLVAAVTENDPTVGLVFYDLKTALRAIREAATADAASTNGSSKTMKPEPEPEPEAVVVDDEQDAQDEPEHTEPEAQPSNGSKRWRRRNR